MQIKITFQGMDHSNPLEQHAKDKLAKLHELLKSEDQKPPFHVELWLKANKLHPHHAAKLHLKTSMFDLITHDEGTDMYIIIDNAVDKMLKTVRREKQKNKDKRQKAETEKKKFGDDKYTLS